MIDDDNDDDFLADRTASRDDDPDEADLARLGRNDFIQCPHCKKSNHPEAVTCRFCKMFLTDDSIAPKKPLWVRAAVLFVLIMAVLCAVLGYCDSSPRIFRR